jgi:hypothetical protein
MSICVYRVACGIEYVDESKAAIEATKMNGELPYST